MPYRKKKTTHRKKQHGKMRLYSMGAPSGIPTTRRAKLRYVTNVSLIGTTGALASNLYRANSLFDPDFTGIGHQPMGFNSWATHFNHYVVMGSKISVSCSTFGSNTTNMVGVFLSDDTGTYANWDAFAEARKGVTKALPNNADKNSHMSAKYSARKFYNISDVKDNVTRIGADVGANPTDVAFFTVWAQSQNKVSTTSPIQCMVTIDYIVEFSEPKDIAQS